MDLFLQKKIFKKNLGYETLLKFLFFLFRLRKRNVNVNPDGGFGAADYRDELSCECCRRKGTRNLAEWRD